MPCFYCGVRLRAPRSKHHPPDMATRDHVVPKSSYLYWTLSDRQKWLDTVPCCRRCNNLKGATHPLHWLAGLDPKFKDQLARRLVDLGFVPAVVARAWAGEIIDLRHVALDEVVDNRENRDAPRQVV